jgi:hypothetical protein
VRLASEFFSLSSDLWSAQFKNNKITLFASGMSRASCPVTIEAYLTSVRGDHQRYILLNWNSKAKGGTPQPLQKQRKKRSRLREGAATSVLSFLCSIY